MNKLKTKAKVINDDFRCKLDRDDIERAIYIIEQGRINKDEASTAIQNYLNKKNSVFQDIFTAITHGLPNSFGIK